MTGAPAEIAEMGETMAQKIGREDAEMPGEHVDIARPAIGGNAETVRQQQGRTVALVEIAGTDSIHVHESCTHGLWPPCRRRRA